MTKNRISELDSLRGMAAFSVLIHHCLLVFPTINILFFSHDVSAVDGLPKALLFTPLHTLWHGHAAVVLFFILSGFVLSIPHYSGTSFNYLDYVVKRVIRLYIPYAAIVIISILLLNFVHSDHGIDHLSGWFNEMWSQKVGLEEAMFMLLLDGYAHNIDTTLWTIGIEIKISLIFPFFIFIIKRLSLRQNLLFLLGYVLIYHSLTRTSVFRLVPELANFFYVTFFLIGALIYKYRVQITSLTFWNRATILLSLTVAVLLFNYEWLLVWFISYNKNSIIYLLNDYVISIASTIFIVVCILDSAVIKRVLNQRLFLFLGKISYSLYLIHPIILLCLTYGLIDYIDYSVIFFIVIFGSIPISYLFYLLVEKPAITLGKSVSSRIPGVVLRSAKLFATPGKK